ncbi:MAG: UTP--glucose-1-phosphate uridylyltransferase, partial [Chlamydiales bacterium]
EGRCACLLLAGGQASRLGCTGPKGCYPVSFVKKKSLFQLVAEKIKAASEQAGYPLQLAIMTSPLNHLETEAFFVQNAFFRLSPHQVSFFYQRMWPFLDFQGNLFLETPDRLGCGPNGNGEVFSRLCESGIWQKWEKMGVQMVNVLPIDNPLAAPFDQELFGFHARHQCEVTIKAAMRQESQEEVGVIGSQRNKPIVTEYSEMTESSLKKSLIANLGLYCFSMSFIDKVKNLSLPIHRAKKNVNRMGETVKAWKFEKFIFDVLPASDHSEVWLYPKERCFAPLKNFQGPNNIDAVQAALLSLDRHVYLNISGVEPPPDQAFELAAEFYYPTCVQLAKWEGQPLPNQPYIEI